MSARKLSADKPRIIYSTVSSHSGPINVWADAGGLVLEVGGYPQSVSLDTPTLSERYWARATKEVASRLEDPKRALVVGVGGGTILHLLTREFPKLAVTGIELDPEIIRVAREFFDLDKIQNLTVVVGDGGEYIKSYLGEPFDLTFVDAYLGGNFPLHFEEGRFLRDLKRVTRAGGVVVINRASGLELGVFKRLLVKVFANVEVIKIPLPGFLGGMGGNYLFICS